MQITFYGNSLKYTKGDKSFEVAPINGATSNISLSTLIDKLGEHYGTPLKDFLLGSETCLILINGQGVQASGGLNATLKSEDKIDILPFVSAG